MSTIANRLREIALGVSMYGAPDKELLARRLEAIAGELGFGAAKRWTEEEQRVALTCWAPAELEATHAADAVEPDCWAICTPSGSRLVSPNEAKGRKDAYPLYTHAAFSSTAGGLIDAKATIAALQARVAELEARQVPEGWVALPPGKVAEYLTSRATCAATEARLAEYGVIVHTAAPSKPEAPDPTP